MTTSDLHALANKFWHDRIVRYSFFSVLTLSSIIGIYYRLILSVIICSMFFVGCATSFGLVIYIDKLEKILPKAKLLIDCKEFMHNSSTDCRVCGARNCPRHKFTPLREPWKNLLVDEDLDNSIESFFTRILNNFVNSWFSVLSTDENFIYAIRQSLREATCRLVLKIVEINPATLLTEKLLPCYFVYYESVSKMLLNGTTMNTLPKSFILNEKPIHPAVINRQAELEYLRSASKCLIPRLLNNEKLNSKVFFSLINEILACWVLLPLMDLISDPNLINLLVIVATNKTKINDNQQSKKYIKGKKVVFLENFIQKEDIKKICNGGKEFLADQNKLYSFMQFLKRNGAVDILRFYLDVDNLNNELLDPRLMTDPAKLSALYQQSEKLLIVYQQMMKTEYLDPVKTLSDAHDDVKMNLQGKWRRLFYKDIEYFNLIYGSREMKEIEGTNNYEPTINAVTKFGSKIKGAIRGAVDGAPLEATEVPTVWDAIVEPQSAAGNTTIYSSVTQKLRKERGQNLDNFMIIFMQSIEQSPDIGEDVIFMKQFKKHKKIATPGLSLVFGDLFELQNTYSNLKYSIYSHNMTGPSNCFIYILVRIMKAPILIVRICLALICVSKKSIDALISTLLNMLVKKSLYQPRLANLIRLLEGHLFGKKQSEPTPQELLERQKLARHRLASINSGLADVLDTLQSPSLNKHIMYSLFDILVADMYPELA